jgi:hypothetical protein
MTPTFFEDCEPNSWFVFDEPDLREPDHELEDHEIDPDRHEPE